jgi:hypothetical protein
MSEEIKATMASGTIVNIFVPNEDFEGYAPDGTLLAHYKKGGHYYIRHGNVMLTELCSGWAAEGKITLLGD